jgi:hypothetical protein
MWQMEINILFESLFSAFLVMRSCRTCCKMETKIRFSEEIEMSFAEVFTSNVVNEDIFLNCVWKFISVSFDFSYSLNHQVNNVIRMLKTLSIGRRVLKLVTHKKISIPKKSQIDFLPQLHEKLFSMVIFPASYKSLNIDSVCCKMENCISFLHTLLPRILDFCLEMFAEKL